MSKPTAKSKQRKISIMAKSQELFNAKGFQETSIQDIMNQEGAAKGAFYYYFESKEQILDALIDQSISEIMVSMKKVMGNPDRNALQKLQDVLGEEFKLSLKSSPDNHIHNIKNVDMHQRILVGMVEKLAPIIADIVILGIKEGLFRTDYPLEVSEIILTGVHFITDLGIFTWSNEEYYRRLKASEELIEKALCLEPGSFNFLSEMLKNTPDRIYTDITNKDI